MRRPWICVLLASLALPAGASTWIDPDWKGLLVDSALIVQVEVVEGGAYVARVRVVATLKGRAPAEVLWVGGFNNPHWPEHGIAEQALVKGKSFVLFLQPIDAATPVSDEGPAGLREAVAAGHAYTVPTPSSGDLPIEGGSVRFHLTRTSYPHVCELRPLAELTALIAAALRCSVPGGTGADRAYLDGARERLARAEAPQEQAHWLTALTLCGEVRGDGLDALAGSEAPAVRFAVARLAGQVAGDPRRVLLLRLLGDKDGVVAGEAVRQLACGAAEDIGPLLLARLDTVAEGSSGPGSIMNPIRNQLDDGKREIVRALGELRYRPAGAKLAPYLETDDDVLFGLVLATLDRLEYTDYVPHLEWQLRHGTLIYEVTERIEAQKLSATRPSLEQVLRTRGDLSRHHRSCIVRALGAVGNSDSATLLAGELRAALERPGSDHDDIRNGNDLLQAVVGLGHPQARELAQAWAFYWTGVDATVAASARLLALKERLEGELTARAMPELAALDTPVARALVWLANREELAGDPQVEPRYSALLRVEAKAPDGLDYDELKPRVQELRTRLRSVLTCPDLAIAIVLGNKHYQSSEVRFELPTQELVFAIARALERCGLPQDVPYLRGLLGQHEARRGDDTLARECVEGAIATIERRASGGNQ